MIEETCHDRGSDATFVDLCREMAAEYVRAGLAAPFQQWHLVPASARSFPGAPQVQEKFEADGWHPALAWQDVTGRSRLDRTTRRGWLGLYPARDADLWPEVNLAAPRLVASVRGDFVAQTRVELGQDPAVHAGLLLWRDEQHFTRLAMHRIPGKRAGIGLDTFLEGRFRHVGRGHCERKPMWLRLERTGEEVRGLVSTDGEEWLACGLLRMPLGEQTLVGIVAFSTYPGAHAWFDTFLLWRDQQT
jgi:regulation of enolase protein 1 (concanavalin A-like superfamily)